MAVATVGRTASYTTPGDTTDAAFENRRAECEGHAVLGDIASILRVVELDVHGFVYGKPV